MASIQYPRGCATAADLAELGMPIVCGRLDSSENPDASDFRWKGWNRAVGGSRSLRAVRSWREGEALAGVTGVAYDVLDVDPRNGGKESLLSLSDRLGDDGPRIFWKVRTPRGGLHLYIACLGIGSHNGWMPGLDLKGGKADGSGRGFVFLPPTVRYGRRYRSLLQGTESDGVSCRALISVIQECLSGEPLADSVSSGAVSRRRSEAELRGEVYLAEAGGQRLALLRYVHEMERAGRDREDIIARCRSAMEKIENFDPRDPWYPASGRDPDRWIKSLLHRPGMVIGDASEEELEGVRSASPARACDESFWEERAVLGHIRDWARSRLVSPWAVLGEALAQAICHTPPSLVLPSVVGGPGTLNLLLAVTGASGAGKSAARSCARDAFAWSGVTGEIPSAIPSVPLGSGEGLVRNFGYMAKDDNGDWVLRRSSWSCLVTIAEIDTFLALSGRSGSTVSGQLRQLYSGEELGFGYADTSKRVVIPAGSYRSCVIAGVQPGRGAVILDDVESGFAQRWLWLPAADPSAPDEQPPSPEAWSWEPPGEVADCSSDYGFAMKVCRSARSEIKADRLERLRGRSRGRGAGEELSAHRMYTRLKVAAGLALLSGSEGVGEEDWELSSAVMAVSDSVREGVRERLRAVAADENTRRGRAEGIRIAVAGEVVDRRRIARVGDAVLRHIPSDGWISGGALRMKIAARDREGFSEALESLVSEGVIAAEEMTYRGQTGLKYRRK